MDTAEHVAALDALDPFYSVLLMLGERGHTDAELQQGVAVIIIQLVSYGLLALLLGLATRAVADRTGCLATCLRKVGPCAAFWGLPRWTEEDDRLTAEAPAQGRVEDHEAEQEAQAAAAASLAQQQLARRRQEEAERPWDLKKLTLCACGMWGAYLTYGILQERIMTQPYTTGKFKWSELLVTCNRIVAALVSWGALCGIRYWDKRSEAAELARIEELPAEEAAAARELLAQREREKKPKAPFAKFALASVGNFFSSWCQYQCLLYISFPMQVLSKSSKIVWTMLLGKLLYKNTYPILLYVTAPVITAGVVLYQLGNNDKESGYSGMNLYFLLGMVLVAGYVLTDAFVSNYQHSLFRVHSSSPLEMMNGVNVCSIFIGLGMLLAHGAMGPAVSFLAENPVCLGHVLLLSLVGAVGQCCIFYTIKEFGAVVFAMIMTCKQVLSVVGSIVLFHHQVNDVGTVGLSLVFVALFVQVYAKRPQAKKTAPKAVDEEEQEPLIKPDALSGQARAVIADLHQNSKLV